MFLVFLFSFLFLSPFDQSISSFVAAAVCCCCWLLQTLMIDGLQFVGGGGGGELGIFYLHALVTRGSAAKWSTLVVVDVVVVESLPDLFLVRAFFVEFGEGIVFLTGYFYSFLNHCLFYFLVSFDVYINPKY